MENSPIQIVCHRGANEFAPENTYASSQICIDWGMDYVEIDVNSSNDGILYVFHGLELEKTTRGKGIIMAHLADDIDQLDAGESFDPKFKGEPIPRLDDYLGWIKGKAKLFLDIKFANLNQLIALIRKHEFENDCFFWFQMPEMAITFRKLAPDLTLKVNANSIAEVKQAIKELDANIVEIDYENASPDLINFCKTHNVCSMIYYQDADEDVFENIINLQPDFINTNYGDRFAKKQKEILLLKNK